MKDHRRGVSLPDRRCSGCGDYIMEPGMMTGEHTHRRDEYTAEGPVQVQCGPVFPIWEGGEGA